MKKLFKNLCLVLSLTLVLFCVGCGKDIEELISKNISEYRHNYFFGSNKSYSVSFTDGKRENDFKMDGVSTSLVDYGVIVLRGNFETLPKFKLKIGNDEFSGEMERNPFDGTFVFDIEQKLPNDNIESIEFSIEGIEDSILLKNISKDFVIKENKALNIFTKNNKNLLIKNIKDNCFNGEIFIKLVAENKNSENIYWYVLCITQSGDVIANLIDVKSGEIVQKS